MIKKEWLDCIELQNSPRIKQNVYCSICYLGVQNKLLLKWKSRVQISPLWKLVFVIHKGSLAEKMHYVYLNYSIAFFVKKPIFQVKPNAQLCTEDKLFLLFMQTGDQASWIWRICNKVLENTIPIKTPGYSGQLSRHPKQILKHFVLGGRVVFRLVAQLTLSPWWG